MLSHADCLPPPLRRNAMRAPTDSYSCDPFLSSSPVVGATHLDERRSQHRSSAAYDKQATPGCFYDLIDIGPRISKTMFLLGGLCWT